MLGNGTYVQAKYDSGCCINSAKNGIKSLYSFHKKCICDDIHEKDQCQEMCSNDTLCKGFVILNDNAYGEMCQLATTVDKCPINCRGPYNKDNVTPLDPEGQCGSDWKGRNVDWEGGCYIKQGMYAKLSSVAFSIRKYSSYSIVSY